MKALSLKVVFVFYVLFISSSIAYSDEVKMAFGLSLPPYVISEKDTGIEMDIIREALKFRGHTLRAVYVSLGQVPAYFTQGKVNAAQRDGGKDLSSMGGHYADVSIAYHDVMITLKKRGIRISKPDDLKGLRAIAFQGAAHHYPKWLEPVKKAGNYEEVGEQIRQVIMLHKGRADVVVADKNIMRYFTLDVLRKGIVRILPMDIHNFTEPFSYRPVFKDPEITDDFNAGLKNLHKTGRYKKIFDSYLNR